MNIYNYILDRITRVNINKKKKEIYLRMFLVFLHYTVISYIFSAVPFVHMTSYSFFANSNFQNKFLDIVSTSSTRATIFTFLSFLYYQNLSEHRMWIALKSSVSRIKFYLLILTYKH